MRLDRVMVPMAVSLAGDVARIRELRDDAVCSALADSTRSLISLRRASGSCAMATKTRAWWVRKAQQGATISGRMS